jgi:hypothetical protein
MCFGLCRSFGGVFDDELFATDFAGEISNLGDGFFAEGDLFADDGRGVDRGALLGERDTNLRLADGSGSRGGLIDGVTLDDELLASDGDLNSLGLDDYFFSHPDFAATNAVLVDTQDLAEKLDVVLDSFAVGLRLVAAGSLTVVVVAGVLTEVGAVSGEDGLGFGDAVACVHGNDSSSLTAGESVAEVTGAVLGYVEAGKGLIEIGGIVPAGLVVPVVPVVSDILGSLGALIAVTGVIAWVLSYLTIGEISLGALVGVGFGFVALEQLFDLFPGTGCLFSGVGVGG